MLNSKLSVLIVSAEYMHGEQLLHHLYLDNSMPADAPTYLDYQAIADSSDVAVSALQPAASVSAHESIPAVSNALSGVKQQYAIEAMPFAAKAEVKVPNMVPVGRQAEYMTAFASQTKLPRTPLLPGY